MCTSRELTNIDYKEIVGVEYNGKNFANHANLKIWNKQ